LGKFTRCALAAAAAPFALAHASDSQPAAPSGCIAGPYIVYFAPDSDRLSPLAQSVLDSAVAAYSNCGPALVMIGGHTDRNGSKRKNARLAQQIAASVENYLVWRGMNARNISTQAFGETRPLIITRDGVDEPRNRRAEVLFGPRGGW
jgi:OOP family OmpA-OmpF porin